MPRAAGEGVSDFRRTVRHWREIEKFQPYETRQARRVGIETFASRARKRYYFRKLPNLVPLRKFCDVVGSHNPYYIFSRIFGGEVFCSIYRITRAAARYFERRNTVGRGEVAQRDGEHIEPVLRARVHGRVAQGCLERGHENDFVDGVRFDRRAGKHNVPEVHGVEAAAHYAESLSFSRTHPFLLARY